MRVLHLTDRHFYLLLAALRSSAIQSDIRTERNDLIALYETCAKTPKLSAVVKPTEWTGVILRRRQ